MPMTKGRDKVAESLSDIQQMIASRRRNGLLSLERYNAGRFEEGEIYFEKGRPVQAFFERLSGQEALTTLASWRNVYYSFTSDVPVPVAPPMPGGAPPYAAPEPLVKPRYTTAPVRQTGEPIPPSPLRRSSQSQIPTTPQPQMRHTSSPNYPPQEEIARDPVTPSGSGNNWGFEALVPHRLSTGQNVLALPLTRTQRSIYLLIDGMRTVADLVRCTSRSMQEVERLLMDLKQQGLIGF